MMDKQERRDTRVTWAITVGDVLKGRSIAVPKGPVEATINVLLNLGWRPSAPDYWVITVAEKGEPTEWIKLDGKNGYTRFQLTARALHDSQIVL